MAETTLAILTVGAYGVAWVLGWWRWQTSRSNPSFFAANNDQVVPGKTLDIGINFSVLAGLVTLSAYLVLRIQNQLTMGGLPSGWFVWGILGSWLVVAVLVLQLNHHRMHVFGLFLLPVALLFFALGYFAPRPSPGELTNAPLFWRGLHAGSLILGTIAVVVAFASGVLYMVQSQRLKRKLPSLGSAIPSLEKLQLFGERGLILSTLAVGLGWLCGVIMNLLSHTDVPIVDWSHPVVWSASLLFGWLVAATAFSLLYEPARYGRKVAYLTIATGLFLALELVVVFLSGHGSGGGRVG